MDKDTIVGDNKMSEEPFIVYNVKEDFPFIYNASIEHVSMCLPCSQKCMRHHAGVGNPLDEEHLKVGVAYISQISESANIILEQTQKILIEHEKQIKELNDAVNRISRAVEANSTSNVKMMNEMKETLKDDWKRFYKAVSIISVPIMIGVGFLLNVIM